MAEQRRALHDIGGRWAISLRAYVVMAPFAVLVVPLTEIVKAADARWVAWTIASAVGYIAAGSVVFAAHRTWFAQRAVQPRAVIEVLVLGALAGAVKGAVTGAIATTLGAVMSSDAAHWGRIATSAGLGTFELAFAAALLAAIERLDTSRLTLLDERIRYRQLALQEEQLSAALRQVAVSDVEQEVNAALRDVQQALQQEQPQRVEWQWQLLGEAITDAAQRRIRPLSHELWAQAELREPRHLSPRDLLALALRRQPLRTATVAGLYVASQLTVVHTWQDWRTTFVVAVIDVIIIAAAEGALRRAMPRLHHPVEIVVGVLAALGIGFGLQPALLGRLPWEVTVLALGPLNAVWFVSLSLAVSLWSVIVAHPEVLMTELQQQVSDSRVRALAAQRETKRVAAELAKFMHGTLQSRLMVAAMYANDPQRRDAAELQTLLERTVAAPLHEFLVSARTSLVDAAARIRDRWEGLMDVTTDIAAGLDGLTRTDLEFLEAVIEEAVANASRHGWAQQVRIDVVPDTGGLLLQVTDDGIGPRIGQPGLGSRLFGSDPRATWELSPCAAGGSRLRLHLAVEPTATSAP